MMVDDAADGKAAPASSPVKLVVSASLDEDVSQKPTLGSSDSDSNLNTGLVVPANTHHSLYISVNRYGSSPLSSPRPLLNLPRSAISSLAHSEQNNPFSDVSSGERAPQIPPSLGMLAQSESQSIVL
jgi:hypothetical protein